MNKALVVDQDVGNARYAMTRVFISWLADAAQTETRFWMRR